VIVACGDVTILGKLDASAAGSTPGAGGAPSNMGAGTGSAGQHAGTSTDSGGGGGLAADRDELLPGCDPQSHG